MVLTMTDQQQYLFDCLKDKAWDENQLKRELEAFNYQVFLDTKSLGKFLIKTYHIHELLPEWAESYFEWDAFIRFGGSCNVYKLPDGTYVHIVI